MTSKSDLARYDDSEERWRPVRGFEGLYEVSNHARVRSVSRWVCAFESKRLVEGRVLQTPPNEDGYYCLKLHNGDRIRHAHVHRIVAEAFVPGFGEVVRHKDGNPGNSVPGNLEWGTNKDNAEDSRKHGSMTVGSAHPNAILNEEIVRSIRKMSSEGYSQVDISRHLGLNRVTVGFVVRRKSWKHVE